MMKTLLPLFLTLATLAAAQPPPAGAPVGNPCFAILVVDQENGRGVPLVELRTVNSAAWWTDSAGLVAFDETGLMGVEVFFHVQSPGYVYPIDGFGNRGVKLRPVPGGSATIKLRRMNVAERLYRITGEGIYRDSVRLGRPVPTRQPLLNGLVMGQDTVIATPYRDKIYWFWGDTDRVSYPLGNFAASGATSELPGRGGLDPDAGLDLNYFVDATGFSKPMCPDFGPGLHWIESVMTVPDEKGVERLVARVASQKGLVPAYAWHQAVFNDDTTDVESGLVWARQTRPRPLTGVQRAHRRTPAGGQTGRIGSFAHHPPLQPRSLPADRQLPLQFDASQSPRNTCGSTTRSVATRTTCDVSSPSCAGQRNSAWIGGRLIPRRESCWPGPQRQGRTAF